MAKAPSQTAEEKPAPLPVCGIIMPIAAMLPKYEASHWSDVRKVLDAAITKAGMTAQIVSDSFESDVIQQRIIHNLYDNPVVICDVSGLNPNVMFELGMRITFKQPVIIITDDVGNIPFDTKVIEHLPYPPDLHIHKTNDFINKLSEKISRLHEQKVNQTFRSFIEAFGTFEVLEPTTKIVGAEELILDRLNELSRRLSKLDRSSHEQGIKKQWRSQFSSELSATSLTFSVPNLGTDTMDAVSDLLQKYSWINDVSWDNADVNVELSVGFVSPSAKKAHGREVVDALRMFFPFVENLNADQFG